MRDYREKTIKGCIFDDHKPTLVPQRCDVTVRMTSDKLGQSLSLQAYNVMIEIPLESDLDKLERVNQWEYDYTRRYKNCWFWGDWQRASYFRDAKVDIRLKDEYITDDMHKMADEMQDCNSVAVHVRRTDYGVFNWILPIEYYDRAFERASKLIDNPHFYLFSDDPEWCKDNMPTGTIVHNDELTDFWLMSKCKHNIIANSTYSFWAAYLNEYKDKKIMYPLDWNIDIKHPVDCLNWEGV